MRITKKLTEQKKKKVKKRAVVQCKWWSIEVINVYPQHNNPIWGHADEQVVLYIEQQSILVLSQWWT